MQPRSRRIAPPLHPDAGQPPSQRSASMSSTDRFDSTSVVTRFGRIVSGAPLDMTAKLRCREPRPTPRATASRLAEQNVGDAPCPGGGWHDAGGEGGDGVVGIFKRLRKDFFFEKKKQKTSGPLGRACPRARPKYAKVFCFFFSKKKSFLIHQNHIQSPRPMHALDSIKLDISSRRRPREKT